jgi:hypothetical protein
MGRGTTGIVCALTGRNFTGIDLYSENVEKSRENIADASKGKYDEKLVEIVAREADIVRSSSSLPQTNGVTLENYLLNKSTSLSSLDKDP